MNIFDLNETFDLDEEQMRNVAGGLFFPGVLSVATPVHIGFPEVCKTPTPGGPVPIPYPNIGPTSDFGKLRKVKRVRG